MNACPLCGRLVQLDALGRYRSHPPKTSSPHGYTCNASGRRAK